MAMIQLRLAKVRKACMAKPGLWTDFLAAGQIAGEHLQISREDFDRLQAKWFPGGLGNIVHEALAPIVQVADFILKTDIQGCSGCAERQMGINRITHS